MPVGPSCWRRCAEASGHSAFDRIPARETYIFRQPAPGPIEDAHKQRGAAPMTGRDAFRAGDASPVRVFKMLIKGGYKGVSLNPWMVLASPPLIQGHLDAGDTLMKALRQGYSPVVKG